MFRWILRLLSTELSFFVLCTSDCWVGSHPFPSFTIMWNVCFCLSPVLEAALYMYHSATYPNYVLHSFHIFCARLLYAHLQAFFCCVFLFWWKPSLFATMQNLSTYLSCVLLVFRMFCKTYIRWSFLLLRCHVLPSLAALFWFENYSFLIDRSSSFCVFVYASDDAPSRKEISHVLVRLLLRRDVKTI